MKLLRKLGCPSDGNATQVDEDLDDRAVEEGDVSEIPSLQHAERVSVRVPNAAFVVAICRS